MAINVRQLKSLVVTGEDGTVTVAPDSAVAAGSTLVLIGVAIHNDTYNATLLTSASDTQSNTWGTPVNVLAGSAWQANPFACVAESVAAGSPTITLNLSYASTNLVSAALFEIAGQVPSGIVDKSVSGTSTSATSTSTAASGTLTQANNLAILCCGGGIGIPENPSGWINAVNQANGVGGMIGCQISYRGLTTTDSVTGTVVHEAGNGAALMLILKEAAAGAALRYKFLLDPGAFTSADTDVTAYVWRNRNPEDGAAEKYTGLAGSATAGTLYIPAPEGASTGDTIIGAFLNDTDGSRPFAPGIVEEV